MLVLNISPGYAQYECGNPTMYWLEANQVVNDSESLKIVKGFLRAYQEKNLDRFGSLLHPDATWIQPGENRISGTKKSRAEILQMFARMFELSDTTVKLAEIRFFDSGSNAVGCVLHWQAAQPIGRVLDVASVGIFTVENGQIISVRIMSENLTAENSFWGKK